MSDSVRPVELFQILKDDAVESAALNMQYAGSRQDFFERNDAKAATPVLWLPHAKC